MLGKLSGKTKRRLLVLRGVEAHVIHGVETHEIRVGNEEVHYRCR